MQVAGVVAGMASAWFAFKQYQSTAASKRKGDVNRNATAVVQTFVCERYPRRIELGFALACGGVAFLGVVWFLVTFLSNIENHRDVGNGLIVLAISVLILFGAATMWEKATAPYTVELSKEHITVRQTQEPRERRIAWSKIDHLADMYHDGQRRRLIAVLPTGSGYLPNLPKDEYIKYENAYFLCDFQKVTPSKRAFREAVVQIAGVEVW